MCRKVVFFVCFVFESRRRSSRARNLEIVCVVILCDVVLCCVVCVCDDFVCYCVVMIGVCGEMYELWCDVCVIDLSFVCVM